MVLHSWTYPLAGFDGGMTNAERHRFELLYYGEASVNPFFETCDDPTCAVCAWLPARAHRGYMKAALEPIEPFVWYTPAESDEAFLQRARREYLEPFGLDR